MWRAIIYLLFFLLLQAMECSNLFLQQLQQFEEQFENNYLGPMAKFWESFLNMVQILLDYIKSTRNGNWDLHLSSMERMLPWFHAYDRVNYARHFTYCWAALNNLAETNPKMYAEFQEGNFAVRRTSGSFNMLSADQVIEQIINKDQKGPGGIIGYTISTGSIQRCVFSSHVIAKINADLQNSIDVVQSSNSVKDLGKKRKLYDEQKVQDCYNLFANGNNPYQFKEELVSINSGVAAEMKEDLLKANEVGEKCLKNFIDKRIKKNEQNLNDPIKNMLLTFESTAMKAALKPKDNCRFTL